MLSKLKGVKRLKYEVDFSFGINAESGVGASGAEVHAGALRSVRAFVPVSAQADGDFVGFGGAAENFLCVVSRNKGFRYDGRLLQKAFDMDGDCSGYVSVCGRGSVYVSPDSGGLYRVDKQSCDDMGALNYDAITYVGERVVGLAMGSKIYFGAAGSGKLATNSSATRNISLQSACQGLASISNNAAYALGPACYKLVFDSDNENIKALKISQGLDSVVSQTVAVLGDTVIFATLSGLYVLKNDKLTRVFFKKGSFEDDYSNCRARIWRGKYVLTNLGREALSYVLDVDRQICCAVLPKGLTDIADFKCKTYAVFSDGTLRVMQSDVYSDLYCAIEGIGFGVMQTKYLRRVNILTKRDMELRLSSEDEMRLYKVRGRRTMQSLTVFLKGGSFNLEIRASGQTELKKLQITADVYEEDAYGS